ncbi:hypothetical protein WJR50_13195 [Catalinimonas sp. 4WD22]|uniref:hypothetical protein n=1 Tax=Catalinimonas locisalis TaxID=3133978 RepID=UPI003100EC44
MIGGLDRPQNSINDSAETYVAEADLFFHTSPSVPLPPDINTCLEGAEEEEDSEDKGKTFATSSHVNYRCQFSYSLLSLKPQNRPFRSSLLYELNCVLIC